MAAASSPPFGAPPCGGFASLDPAATPKDFGACAEDGADQDQATRSLEAIPYAGLIMDQGDAPLLGTLPAPGTAGLAAG